MPIVSIVVPVYNVDAHEFARCVDSLRRQTLSDIEIILVDDGSSDGSGELCDLYAGEDARITAMHQPNSGASVSRNAGLRAAKGEYVTFLDSDDWAELDLCERAVDAFEAHGVDIVFWAYTLERGKMEPLVSRILPADQIVGCASTSGGSRSEHREPDASGTAPRRVSDGSEATAAGKGRAHLQSLMLYNTAGRRKQPYYNMIGSPWTKMYRRSLLLDNEVFFDPDLPRAQDIEHSHRAFGLVDRAFYLAQPMYHHVFITQGSNSRRYTEKFGEYYARACGKIREHIRACGDDAEVLEAFYVLACELMLGVGPNNAFHPDNPKSVREQIAYYRGITMLPAFDEAVQNADMTVLPLSHNISGWFVKHRMYWVIYLICKVRQLQMKLWKG